MYTVYITKRVKTAYRAHSEPKHFEFTLLGGSRTSHMHEVDG